jgi:hypothetical protein
MFAKLQDEDEDEASGASARANKSLLLADKGIKLDREW